MGITLIKSHLGVITHNAPLTAGFYYFFLFFKRWFFLKGKGEGHYGLGTSNHNALHGEP